MYGKSCVAPTHLPCSRPLYTIVDLFSYHDHQDEKRLISRPLVDNRDDDYYMYEILTFTGHHQGASCDSRVQVWPGLMEKLVN